MSSNNGNIKRYKEAEEVNKPNCEDFGIFNVISEGIVKAQDCEGNLIPFYAGGSGDVNLGIQDLTQTDLIRNYDGNGAKVLHFFNLGVLQFTVDQLLTESNEITFVSNETDDTESLVVRNSAPLDKNFIVRANGQINVPKIPVYFNVSSAQSDVNLIIGDVYRTTQGGSNTDSQLRIKI